MSEPTFIHPQPPEENLSTGPARMLTYAEAAELLAINIRTLRRRIANGKYLAYGEGPGRRVLYHSILADISRACGEPS